MKTTVEFLDAMEKRLRLPSDYALAKHLQENPNRISNYRTGTSKFDEEMCLRVAAILDLAPGYVLACVAAERTKSERVKKEWEKVAGLAAVLALVAILPQLGGALPLEVTGFPSSAPTLYIMLKGSLLFLFVILILPSIRSCDR